MLDDIFDYYDYHDGVYGGDNFLNLVSHQWSPEQIFSPWLDHAGITTPHDDAAYWRLQQTNFTCAVVCQQMILNQFGIDVSEAQLVYDAAANGWLTQSGTALHDMGKLLEYYGVPVHYGYGEGVEAIVSEIARGHKVIAAVDSGELWKQDSFFEDWINPHGRDHAVMVYGVDFSDVNCPKVVLNDPGDPGGKGKPYPLEEFLDAWRDSNYFYVATDYAPTGLADHSQFGAHFNPHTGMYMDEDFWLKWLGEVTSGFDVALFMSLLSDVAGSASGDAVMPTFGAAPTWDMLDDAARNELFLSVI